MLKFILSLFLAIPANAGQIAITGKYSGLNDTDPAITLAEGEAQDLLNVASSKDGNSIIKRDGYSLIATLAVSSYPIHGAILFKDSSGNNIEVYAVDRFIYKSVGGASYSAIISTATSGAKWCFCETAGKIYGFNDKHDIPFQYDGNTVTYLPAIPKASICAMTPDRMLISGTTDQPNRVYFSAVGEYTNFTVGVETFDSSFEDIGLSGDKITGLWANSGEWLIFKTNSLISYQGTNQYDLVPSVISNKVGLSDPKAIVEHAGVIYFRGTDGRIWAYNSGQLLDITKTLKSFIATVVTDNIQSQSYSSKADFDLGSFSNTASTITNGSVEPWLGGIFDTLDADFSAGTASSVTIISDAMTINNFNMGEFPNIGLEDYVANSTKNWTPTSITHIANSAGTMYGTYIHWLTGASGVGSYLAIYNESGTEIYRSPPFPASAVGVIPERELDISTQTATAIKMRVYVPLASGYTESIYFLKPSAIKYKAERTSTATFFDFPEPTPTVYSGTYISKTLDTNNTGQKYCHVESTKTVPNTTYALTYYQTSTNNVNWGSLTSTTDYLNISTTSRYIRYQLSFQDTTSYIKPYVYGMTLNCIATGTWTSPEINIGTFSTWGTFTANETTDRASHWTYQITSTNIAGGTASSTYYSIATSSSIGITIAPYVKIKANNSFSSSTETVRLDDIQFTYGTISNKLSSGFEYLGNIYFTMPVNDSATNNRMIKLDLESGGWWIFDIAGNYPIVVGNNVHFGDTSNGKIYTYPSGESDNGAAINSYWKSRDYMGDSVYVERVFDKLSLFMDSDYASDVDVTYSLEPSTSVSFNMPLTQTDGSKYIRNNRQLPLGTRGSIFNLKIANNAAGKPFRFYGAVIDYTNDGWIVYP